MGVLIIKKEIVLVKLNFIELLTRMGTKITKQSNWMNLYYKIIF